ncbi:Membrane associated serine protease, rhomboid family [Amycolatopsis lurida]|uniref:Peptidase S54 family protein n=1 Tax=Amycolatopsis lurida NRRL 2430 TaxID=1460371 RepID=A0A2P2FVD7_AMYLU|nr:rhomboid family intramembrane serine protease [Amycolatopsis lurida]KFU80698.1 peptidase S54 family protein [Amycolatopsis lurida NRRL 2430]SED44535.1 Membrane associated serine protease, rhomboid family [Amycolatopsis lurida]
MNNVGDVDRPGARDAEAMIAEAKKAFGMMAGVLVVIWLIHLYNALSGFDLTLEYGSRAREISSLPTVFTSPLLHSDWAHIAGNSGPLFIFGFLAAYRGVKKFLGVTVLIAVVSGLGGWFLEPGDSISVGASGLVFGYFGYVMVRGFFDRHKIDIMIGLVMALCFAYQYIPGLFPQDAMISWQAHLFGFIGGLIGGWVFRDRRPKPKPVDPAILAMPLLTDPFRPSPKQD